ncbi:MAG: hypothetical protein AMXMBFR84_07610 [Candidatus Hydrogenedentota bacterium]
MKHWTVMLIPHGQGTTRSLNLSAYHMWVVVGAFVVLSFSTTFSLQLYRSASENVTELQQEQRRQKLAIGAQAAPESQPASDASLPENARTVIEAEVRKEYEERLSKITAELGELYDLEKRLRNDAKLPPRSTAPRTFVGSPNGLDTGGQGGSPGSELISATSDELELIAPPQIIYGLSRPSADLIKEEISLRIASYTDLLDGLSARSDQVERMPAEWPLSRRYGQVSSRFGYRQDPFSRRLRHHDGMDIRAPAGTKIHSTGKGKVVEAGWDGYLGNMVRVDHGNGLETVYGHMRKILVSEGTEVSRGDVLGEVGSTGRSTGNHVHYEVRKNGRQVDPEKYLGN